nr:S-layer homology domain-containing protein [Cohnella sp. WQ 127256]
MEFNKRFSDVPVTHWAARALQVLAVKHVVYGVSVDLFAPNAPITRAEMTVLIARALGLKDDANVNAEFADSKDIPVWAKSSVAALKQMGIIQGREQNRFYPQANATRAEAAKLILEVINQLK